MAAIALMVVKAVAEDNVVVPALMVVKILAKVVAKVIAAEVVRE